MNTTAAVAAPGPRVALLTTCAVLGAGVLAFLDNARLALQSPFSKDYGEGCVLALTQLLAERGTYFTSLRDYPFVHGIYPPLFIVLNWAGYQTLGPSLWFPRLLSLLATVAVTVLVFLLVRALASSRAVASVAAGLFLAPWFVRSFAPLARVDMLAIALSLSGLYLGHRAWTRGGSFTPALLLCGLGFFTKQSALLAPFALLLGLLLDRAERPRLPAALLSFVAPVALVLGALFLATGGEAYRHLFPYTAAADYSLPQLLLNLRQFLVLTLPLQAAIVMGLTRLGRDAGRGFLAVLSAYWLLNLAALSTFAKAGAAQNYFLEPYLATVLLAACMTGRWLKTAAPGAAWWPAGALVAALAAFLVQHADGRLPFPVRNPDGAHEYRVLNDAVRGSASPILSENLSVLVLNRKPVAIEPFGLVLLSRQGLWSAERLAADCRARRFPLVIEEHRLRDIPGLAECLDTFYAPWQTLGPYDLLRPR